MAIYINNPNTGQDTRPSGYKSRGVSASAYYGKSKPKPKPKPRPRPQPKPQPVGEPTQLNGLAALSQSDRAALKELVDAGMNEQQIRDLYDKTHGGSQSGGGQSSGGSSTPAMEALRGKGMPGVNDAGYAEFWNNQPFADRIAAARSGTWQGSSMRDFFNLQYDTSLPDDMRREIAKADAFRSGIGYSDPVKDTYVPPTNGMGPDGNVKPGGVTTDNSFTGGYDQNAPNAPTPDEILGTGGNSGSNPSNTQTVGGNAGGGQSGGGTPSTPQAPIQQAADDAGFGTGTGLKGSESAMLGGYNNALAALEDAVTGAKGSISGGYDNALDAIRDAGTGAQGSINAGYDAATGLLDPIYQAGVDSNDLQAALSGARGEAAQQEAYDNFISSPGQQWLRDKAETAITRNAAATGGLRGGNVLQALQKNATGLAAQDFNNSFNRLGSLSDRGAQAGGAMAGLEADRGNNLAQVGMNTGQQVAGLETGRGNTLGQIDLGTGDTIADMNYGLGNTLGGQRYDAGQRISSNIGNTTNALAQLQDALGGNQANVIGQDSGNLANIIAGMGDSQNASANKLAGILANLATGQGGAVAGLPSVGGLIQSDDSISNALQALGGIASAYGQYKQGAA